MSSTAERESLLSGLHPPPGENDGPASLDELAADWRAAFDAAAVALRAAAGSRFPDDELHQRSGRLEQERTAVASLLEAIARDERVELNYRLNAPRATRATLGLPAAVHACVFDLDGVLTASAAVHAAAWAETFDELLWRRVERTGERFAPFRPFNPRTEYDAHLHGRPRLDGVRAFLASRGISLPEGGPGDPPGAETVNGLGNRKNEALLELLARQGVTAFRGSRLYLETAREAELPCAVVSASANTAAILERAGLAYLIEARVDGDTIRTERLRAKPAPDTLLAACRRLGVEPGEVAAYETTLAGIDAARVAGFALVVGVHREGRADELRTHGADVVVGDLTGLLDLAAR